MRLSYWFEPGGSSDQDVAVAKVCVENSVGGGGRHCSVRAGKVRANGLKSNGEGGFVLDLLLQ